MSYPCKTDNDKYLIERYPTRTKRRTFCSK